MTFKNICSFWSAEDKWSVIKIFVYELNGTNQSAHATRKIFFHLHKDIQLDFHKFPKKKKHQIMFICLWMPALTENIMMILK